MLAEAARLMEAGHQEGAARLASAFKAAQRVHPDLRGLPLTERYRTEVGVLHPYAAIVWGQMANMNTPLTRKVFLERGYREMLDLFKEAKERLAADPTALPIDLDIVNQGIAWANYKLGERPPEEMARRLERRREKTRERVARWRRARKLGG